MDIDKFNNQLSLFERITPAQCLAGLEKLKKEGFNAVKDLPDQQAFVAMYAMIVNNCSQLNINKKKCECE